MASDPYGMFSFNQRVVSFQTTPVIGSPGVLTGGLDGSSGINCLPTMVSNTSMALVPCTSPRGVIEPVQGLKYGATMSTEWSCQEVAILRDGLERFPNEPSIMKYIKIAAMLPEKTVRDVAMRCQWMMKKENAKRRKHEEFYAGKKIKDRKEKLSNLSQGRTNNSVQTEISPHSSAIQNGIQVTSGDIADNEMGHLLDENARLLSQIAANIDAKQIWNNRDLFSRTRSNIAALLNSMSQMPGIMSRMPSLPVSINEYLINSVLLSNSMVNPVINGRLKDEPSGW